MFINIGTLEIYCFKCNIEILDESVKDLTTKNKPIIALKAAVKNAFKSAIFNNFSTDTLTRITSISRRMPSTLWHKLHKYGFTYEYLFYVYLHALGSAIL